MVFIYNIRILKFKYVSTFRLAFYCKKNSLWPTKISFQSAFITASSFVDPCIWNYATGTDTLGRTRHITKLDYIIQLNCRKACFYLSCEIVCMQESFKYKKEYCSFFQINYDSCNSTGFATEEYMNTSNFIPLRKR